jgi:hypothetical protein
MTQKSFELIFISISWTQEDGNGKRPQRRAISAKLQEFEDRARPGAMSRAHLCYADPSNRPSVAYRREPP